MKALVYISPSLQNNNMTNTLIENLQNHFEQVNIETKKVKFMQIMNSNEYEYILAYVSSEKDISLLINTNNTSSILNFFVDNPELRLFIQQESPSTDVYSSVEELIQNINNDGHSDAFFMELEAPSSDELDDFLSEGDTIVHQHDLDDTVISHLKENIEISNIDYEDKPINFIDINDDDWDLEDELIEAANTHAKDEHIEVPEVKATNNESVTQPSKIEPTKEIVVEPKVEPKTESNVTNVNTAPSENTMHKEVAYEENPIYSRTRQIQKNLFAQQQWADHKVIGLWSPVGRTGVSTFAINFALYLAKNRIYTTVLEGLTPQPHLKQMLSRYTKVPKGWGSYASTVQEDNEPRIASWIYENVVFLPCTKSDLKYTWNPALIEAYMTTTKICDVTLVDFPSGNLQEYSKDALHYVDELWILFDDNYHELLNWKLYIQELAHKLNIPIHLIMGRTYEFSQSQKISNEMGLPLISTIPAMDGIAMYNQYQNIPLYYVEEAQEKLEPAYHEIASHLFKTPFKRRTLESTSPKSSASGIFKKFYNSILKA